MPYVVLQQTIKEFQSLNIDKEYADKVSAQVRSLTFTDWPANCSIRLADTNEVEKSLSSTLVNAFRAIKKRDRPPFPMNKVSTAAIDGQPRQPDGQPCRPPSPPASPPTLAARLVARLESEL